MAEDVRWCIGEEVLCHGKVAAVRYIGEVQNTTGIYIGVEFIKANAGKHDGEVDGVRYFGPTPLQRGLLVRLESGSIAPYEAQVEAATKLQAQARRAQAAEEVHFAKIFKAYNNMESRSESERLAESLSTRGAENLLASDLEADASMARPITPKAPGGRPCSESLEAEAAEVQLEDDGIGVPVLQFFEDDRGHTRVPRPCLERVLRHFKRPGSEPLASSCVARLLQHGISLLFRDVPCALRELQTPEAPGRIVVLGDTHGQLEDVLWCFFEHGEPSLTNVYLFNGDVADRGCRATEIMILILLFKLWEPGCVHMNRGNHEDPIMNDSYGFRDECAVKWPGFTGWELFNTFNELFEHLPLATLIDNQVFVIHGGLWRRDFRLSQLRRVHFRRRLPERPGVGMDIMMFDSVWSDPHEGRGIGANGRGDSIVSFGADVTKRFLRSDGLRLLVRSHQVPDSGQGYEWHHQGTCLTVFSASNYCGDCGNLGGVLVLTRGEPEQIFEHWAPSLEELAILEEEADRAQARIRVHARCVSQQRSARGRAIQRMEADIVRRVQELIVRRKADLFDYWSEADASPRGSFCIPAKIWREGCAAVLDAGLPWVRLQEALGVADVRGDVPYVKFLTRYRVAFDSSFGVSTSGWERSVWSKLMETLLRADLPLREALAALDSTSDGLVSSLEFSRLLESCRVKISPLQARALLRSLAVHPSSSSRPESAAAAGVVSGTAGRVSVWDMLERLTVTLPVPSTSVLEAETIAWAVAQLRPLASAILDDAWRRLVPPGGSQADWPMPKVLAAWFENVDSSGNGFLDEDEFVVALVALGPALEQGGCPTDEESLRRLARFCDVGGNGRINYFELLNSLTWEESLGDDFRQDLMESLHSAMYFNVAPARSSLQKFDSALSGRVSPDNFVKALRAVHAALSATGEYECGLSRTDIEDMALHLPRCDDGCIDYEAFLKSFRIVDTFAPDRKSVV